MEASHLLVYVFLLDDHFYACISKQWHQHILQGDISMSSLFMNIIVRCFMIVLYKKFHIWWWQLDPLFLPSISFEFKYIMKQPNKLKNLFVTNFWLLTVTVTVRHIILQLSQTFTHIFTKPYSQPLKPHCNLQLTIYSFTLFIKSMAISLLISPSFSCLFFPFPCVNLCFPLFFSNIFTHNAFEKTVRK